MLELIVTARSKEITKGAFKVGCEVTLDLDDMVVYHNELTWNTVKSSDGYELAYGSVKFKIA